MAHDLLSGRVFNRSGFHRLSDYYRMQRQHADAHSVASGFERLLQFPTTFDGSMPASTFAGERPPIKIGETYNFEGAGSNDGDVIGTVAHALVNEDQKTVTIAVNCRDGKSVLLEEPMSDAQLADYRSFPEANFGEIVRAPKGIKTPADMFEFLLYAYRGMSRDDLLSKLSGRVPGANSLENRDLLEIFCEGMVSTSNLFVAENGVTTAKPRVPRQVGGSDASQNRSTRSR